jgi:hypothetical protein
MEEEEEGDYVELDPIPNDVVVFFWPAKQR